MSNGEMPRYLRRLLWRAVRHRRWQGGPVLGGVPVEVGDVSLLLPPVAHQRRLETLSAALVPDALRRSAERAGVAGC